MSVRPDTPREVRVRQVVEAVSARGRGVDADPVRLVRQFYDFDGTLLAEHDPCADAPDAVVGTSDRRAS